MRLVSSIKDAFVAGARSLTTKEGLKALYRVSLYRNAVYLLLEYGATALLGFVFWILAARFYPTDEVGLASAALAIAGFLVAISHLGLDYGLIRFLPNAGEKSNAMVNSCLTIGGLAAIVCSLIFLVGLNVWSPDLIFLRQTPLLIGTFVFLVVALALYPQLHNVYVAQKRAEFSLWHSIIQGVIKLVLIAALATTAYGFGILAASGIGWILAVVIGLFFFLPRLQGGYKPSFTIKKGVVNELFHFSMANYAANLVSKVPPAILPLIIVSLLGAEQNAYFYMAFAVIGSGLNAIPASVSLSLFAEGSHDEKALGQHVKRSLKFSFLILVPLIILVFLIGDKILLLFGEAYSEEATHLLWILALSSLFITVNTIYFFKKRVEKEMRNVILLTVLIVAITLGLSYLLLPVMGIMGAGIGWLAGNGAVTAIIIGILLTRKSGGVMRF